MRALHVLALLSENQRTFTLSAISESLHIPKASLIRLMQALEDEGYVQRDLARQGFAIGPTLATLSLHALQNHALAHRYRPLLEQLVKRLGESCNLTAMAGDSVVYLDRVETHHPLRLSLAPGSRVPLHCTASGKLLLAEMPPADCEALVSRLTLTRNTPQSLCEAPALLAALTQIRKQGYGVDNEEFVKGMVAVALPVRNASGHCVATVACHAPTARYGLDDLLEQVDLIRHTAARVAQTLAPGEMT